LVQQPNPVLYYHPDEFRVAREDLKGRHSAGESFLTAFLEYAPGPDVYALCRGAQSFEQFRQSVGASGRALTAHAVGRNDLDVLSRQAVLNLPEPGIVNEARVRSLVGENAYALCGVTHAISSREVLADIADLVVAPVTQSDAVICASKAVHDAVSGVLDRAEDHMRARLGAQKFNRPMLPIIPLGVHSSRFAPSGERARWRKELGIADDAVAILFFGRLSTHAKASPFQLAQSVEMAAARCKRPLAVIWCGWFHDDFQRRVFTSTAKSMAPSVTFHFVDGRSSTARFSIWSAGDIFCSLSDNIQESFGLTVIEAMAAGLPAVVSNWNGYREAIENGVNGFLIDSYMPPGTLADAAYRYVGEVDTYDAYIGGLSQLCFVDVEQTAATLSRLADDAAMRSEIAAAARRTVAERFDWKVVIAQYAELWSEQIGRVRKAGETEGKPSAFAPLLDPANTFAGYPSHRLNGSTLLARGALFDRWDDLVKQPGIIVNAAIFGGPRQLQALYSFFADKEETTVGDVVAALDPDGSHFTLRTIHWLIKVGLLRMRSTNS
jgi:glycosyltransferase involved in cell wall biosynthesis